VNLRVIDWGVRVVSVGSGHGPLVGPCEHDDEPSVSGGTELVIY
jgi:hypothetical protein